MRGSQSDNVTPEIKAAGAGSGAPIQNINDMGVEAGGPIKRDKLWFWGSYGTQDIKVGVVNFYKNTPECRPAGVPVGDIAKILADRRASATVLRPTSRRSTTTTRS